jgi:hypothetical protein
LNKPERLGPACLARAIAIDNSAFRQVIWRKFDVYTVAGKNFDAMPAQTAGDVRQHDMAIVEFDGKSRAWEHLLDAAENLDRRFAVILDGFDFGSAGIRITFASCDNAGSFRSLWRGAWRT